MKWMQASANLAAILALVKRVNKMSAAYEVLLEKEAVIEVVNRLFIHTDNRDWLKVRQCFSDEVLFDMTSVTGGEPARMTSQAIVEAWEKGLKDLKALHHQAGNHIAKLVPDGAEVFCYGIASHYLPNKTNQNTRTFVGSYDFHLTKKSGDWRIDKFKFNLKYIEGNLNLEASR